MTSGDVRLMAEKCMDARVFPEAIFHLQYGEAHVVRNAGANGPAALHEIVVSRK